MKEHPCDECQSHWVDFMLGIMPCDMCGDHPITNSHWDKVEKSGCGFRREIP